MPENYSFIKSKLFSISFFVCVLFFFNCSKDKRLATVPSYLEVSNYSVQYSSTYTNGGPGTTSHNFSDVEVFVDGDNYGIYPIPCKIPVLLEGEAKVQIYPMIKVNGVSTLRSSYVYMKAFDTIINFKAKEKIELTPRFDYFPGIKFKWTEDFEGSGYSLVGNELTVDTSFRRISSEKFEGGYGLDMYLPSNVNLMTVKSSSFYYIPQNAGNNVYLEFHYKSDVPFQVGTIGNNGEFRSAGGGNPSGGEWKKLYVFLTSIINQPPLAGTHAIFFQIARGENSGIPHLYLDNIKLISQE